MTHNEMLVYGEVYSGHCLVPKRHGVGCTGGQRGSAPAALCRGQGRWGSTDAFPTCASLEMFIW